MPFSKKRKLKATPLYTADGRGWGLHLDKRVDKGVFFRECVGEVITKKQLHSRLANKQSSDRQDYSVMKISSGLYIDSEKKGNIARFMNSSCDLNCVSQKWNNPATGQTHVGFFADKNLDPAPN